MKILKILLLAAVSLTMGSAQAQVSYAGVWPSTWDIVAGPSTVRANAGAGNCGCFYMNGADVQLAITRGSGAGVLAEYDTVSVTNINDSLHNVALATYMAGARYRMHPRKRIQLYGHVLAGISHTSTNLALDNDATGLAYAGGGGLDYALTRQWSVRAIQVEYLMTQVPNGVNDRQNQTRFMIGIVFHMYRPGF